MKLASLETGIVLLPNDEPLAGFSENPNAKNPIVWLRLRTDDGIEGLGVTYFGGALTRTLGHAVDELGALVIGNDPLRPEAIAKKLRDAAGSAGPAGLLTMAMSAIDVALWDLQGKAAGLALGELPGGGPAAVEAARRRARPHPHLCQRRAAARPQAGGGGYRRRPAAREGLSPDQ